MGCGALFFQYISLLVTLACFLLLLGDFAQLTHYLGLALGCFSYLDLVGYNGADGLQVWRREKKRWMDQAAAEAARLMERAAAHEGETVALMSRRHAGRRVFRCAMAFCSFVCATLFC